MITKAGTNLNPDTDTSIASPTIVVDRIRPNNTVRERLSGSHCRWLFLQKVEANATGLDSKAVHSRRVSCDVISKSIIYVIIFTMQIYCSVMYTVTSSNSLAVQKSFIYNISYTNQVLSGNIHD